MDLPVRSAPVPQVDEHPQAVDRQSEQGEDDDHLEIQAVEEGLHLGDREEQGVLVDILPGTMPQIIRRLTEKMPQPLIASGLLQDKSDVMAALSAGAIAISTTDEALWFV